ncbi:MAG TPA: hypothetical protein VK459_08400, partial [Polyangiaceae bacterium]|nr:hypothetical protein [Polyangiaceae bacterium]
ALQAVHMQNAKEPGSIQSVALPGLGANTGRVPVEICADLMWTAYRMYLDKAFTDFKEMRAALEEELGDLEAGKEPKKKGSAAVKAGAVAAAASASAKKKDIDFDDHEGGKGSDEDFDDSETEDDDTEDDDDDDDDTEDDDDFDDHE